MPGLLPHMKVKGYIWTSVSYRNQKSVDWFLYDADLHHEGVNR